MEDGAWGGRGGRLENCGGGEVELHFGSKKKTEFFNKSSKTIDIFSNRRKAVWGGGYKKKVTINNIEWAPRTHQKPKILYYYNKKHKQNNNNTRVPPPPPQTFGALYNTWKTRMIKTTAATTTIMSRILNHIKTIRDSQRSQKDGFSR